MGRDLRSILDGWPFEPGKISVRKIIGRDGGPRIQTRVDLGVLQMTPTGRPDAEKPHGCESYLAYFEQRLRRYVQRNGSDAGFSLKRDDCRELRYESHLYYQRYLSLFVLEEFDGVVRDTSQNLRAIDLVTRYARGREDRFSFESRRAYVTMMMIRAQTYLALNQEAFEDALTIAEAGLNEVVQIVQGDDSADFAPPTSPELDVLEQLRNEVLAKLPEGSRARLTCDLQEALAAEDYEQAARLRDQLGE